MRLFVYLAAVLGNLAQMLQLNYIFTQNLTIIFTQILYLFIFLLKHILPKYVLVKCGV